MNNKKQKRKEWLKKNKWVLVGSGSFVLLGGIAVLIGFEIQQDWHAIRNWLSSPFATTFLICFCIGSIVLVLLILILLNFKKGDE